MLAVTVGRPSIWITQPSWSNLPVGFQRLALAPPDVELDDDLVAERPLPTGRHSGDASRRDGPRPEVEIGRRLRVLGLTPNIVQLDPECVGDHPHGFGEDRGAVGRHRLEFGVVDRLAKAHWDFGRR